MVCLLLFVYILATTGELGVAMVTTKEHNGNYEED